jgi:hypothetical protein
MVQRGGRSPAQRVGPVAKTSMSNESSLCHNMGNNDDPVGLGGVKWLLSEVDDKRKCYVAIQSLGQDAFLPRLYVDDGEGIWRDVIWVVVLYSAAGEGVSIYWNCVGLFAWSFHKRHSQVKFTGIKNQRGEGVGSR